MLTRKPKRYPHDHHRHYHRRHDHDKEENENKKKLTENIPFWLLRLFDERANET